MWCSCLEPKDSDVRVGEIPVQGQGLSMGLPDPQCSYIGILLSHRLILLAPCGHVVDSITS